MIRIRINNVRKAKSIEDGALRTVQQSEVEERFSKIKIEVDCLNLAFLMHYLFQYR